MHNRRSLLSGLAALALLGVRHNAAATGGNWPERNVRFIVPAPAGSSIDLAARLFGDRLAARWNKAVVVENNPGADGIIAARSVIDPQDNHMFLFSFPGVVTVVPVMHANLPYDPRTDLLPISSVAEDFLALAVPANLEVDTLADFVTRGRKEPGRLNWTTSPGAPYLTFLDFEKRAGIDMTYVPYRSVATALTDLAAGRIQFLTTSLALALPLVHDGKVKLLAVTTRERSQAIPNTPTVSEAGHPELTVEAPLGLFGPKSLSPDLRARIAADVQEVAKDQALAERLRAAGMIVRTSTPDAYATMLEAQRARWGELARAYGVQPIH